MEIRERLEGLRRNMIELAIGAPAEDKRGGTRFGGVPDVPEDFEWPFFESEAWCDDEVKPRPLAFLAQFDCAELGRYDTEGLLPGTGVLSFFYEVESQRWGFDPKDAGCARVYWFEDAAALRPARVPEALSGDARFPALRIYAKSALSLPDGEDFDLQGGLGQDGWDEFEEERVLLGCERAESCSKLLGWPDVIQNNMTAECELVSRGHYLGGGWEGIPESDIQDAKQTSLDNWRLLFQLDIVQEGDFELMFGDCGRIYFYIRREDLLARRFDRVWLILQCY